MEESARTRKLIAVRKVLRKKLLSLKLNRNEEDETLKKVYKPIIEPLQKLADLSENNFNAHSLNKNEYKLPHIKRQAADRLREAAVNKRNECEEEVRTKTEEAGSDVDYEDAYEDAEDDSQLNQYNAMSRMYLKQLLDKNKAIDTSRIGITFNQDSGNFKIGNSTIEFDEEDFIIEGFRYAPTVGLYELLFKKYPRSYMHIDLQNYMHILLQTNALKRNYDPAHQNCGLRTDKYRNIIKPLLALREKPSHSGGGVDSKMRLDKNERVQYRYWDSITELVDRLCLLHEARKAGNNGVNNEIIAIEDELREANVIV